MEDKKILRDADGFFANNELTAEELDEVAGGGSASRPTYRLAAGGAVFRCECGYVFKSENLDYYMSSGCPNCKGRNCETIDVQTDNVTSIKY